MSRLRALVLILLGVFLGSLFSRTVDAALTSTVLFGTRSGAAKAILVNSSGQLTLALQ